MWRIIGSSTHQDYGKREEKVPEWALKMRFCRSGTPSKSMGQPEIGDIVIRGRPPFCSARAENENGPQNFSRSSPGD